MEMSKLLSKSNPKVTAGDIAYGIRQYGEPQLQVTGPRAVNQAVKAVAIARGYTAPSGGGSLLHARFQYCSYRGRRENCNLL